MKRTRLLLPALFLERSRSFFCRFSGERPEDWLANQHPIELTRTWWTTGGSNDGSPDHSWSV